MNRDDLICKLVCQWAAKAQSDYRVAERLIGDSDPLRDAIAFSLPAGGGEYLKAFLTWRQVKSRDAQSPHAAGFARAGSARSGGALGEYETADSIRC